MGIAAVSVMLMGSVTAIASGPATAAGRGSSRAACPQWDGVQPPVTASAFLNGISVLPSCEAFAVGKTNNRPRMLIEIFSGSSWTKQGIPALAGASSELSGVTAMSPTSAWAVGSEHPAGAKAQDLVLSFNGSSWKPQALPPVAHGATSGSLAGVAASSGRDVWAVGSYEIGEVQHAQILHGDGSFWKASASPHPGGPGHSSRLTSVTVVSRKDAWAAGYYRSAKFTGPRTLILHWNGKTWTQVASPTPTRAHQGMLFGITATSPRNAWAVGYTTKPDDSTLVLHWNGRTWSRQPSPNPPVPAMQPVHLLFAVSATSVRNAWAAGYENLGGYSPLILHWDGHAWRFSPDPGVDGDEFLAGVAASPVGGTWVVGNFVTINPVHEGAFAMRWNGTTWQR